MSQRLVFLDGEGGFGAGNRKRSPVDTGSFGEKGQNWVVVNAPQMHTYIKTHPIAGFKHGQVIVCQTLAQLLSRMMAYLCNPSTWRYREENQGFNTIHSYTYTVS